MTHVLSFLDAQSLLQAEAVSRSWSRLANSHHTWKQAYLKEFSRHPLDSHRLAQGSRGVSGWKHAWGTQRALEKRWQDGYAAAIYLEGHTDSVYCVQFDDKKILTGSRDCTVRVWDAKTYECIRVLGAPAHNRSNGAPPLPLDTPDFGRQPFTRVYSPHTIASPKLMTGPVAHSGSVLCLQYDEELLVTGSSDSSLITWEIANEYEPVRRLISHTSGVLDVCFDDLHIVSCSKDATVKVWNRKTGELIRNLSGHRGPVNAIQLRGNMIVSASGDSVAKLWNLASGLCIKEFPSKDRGMACVEFSLDKKTLFAGGNDKIIYQFDVTSGELVQELKGHEELVRSLHLDSQRNRLVSGSYDHSVKAFDVKTGELLLSFVKWTSSWILSAKADYRRIVATSQDSRAVIMDFGYQLPGIEALEAQ